jgi:hypothetical protein
MATILLVSSAWFIAFCSPLAAPRRGGARRTDPTVLVDAKVGSVDDPIFDKAVDLVLHEPPPEECFDGVDTRTR